MARDRSAHYDLLIIGGGVVGLSLAYEMSGRGRTVCLVDRQQLGRESSWAGAGIIPPASWYNDAPALQQLATGGYELLARWSRQLREETGIDNGWRISGGIHLMCQLSQEAFQRVDRTLAGWGKLGIGSQGLSRQELAELEPRLADSPLFAGESHEVARFVAAEAQIRNPRHLSALQNACRRRGVVLLPNTAAHEFELAHGRILGVATDRGRIGADQVCLAAGCWTGKVAAQVGTVLPVRPVRGQIAMLKDEHKPPRAKIVHWRGNYLVPRDDGRLLVGATVEDAGYSKSVSVATTDALLQYADQLGAGDVELEASWVGLRPAAVDDLPVIGRLATFDNGWVATGHYRAGLQMAPSTAVAVADLLEGRRSRYDLSSFSIERFDAANGPLR